MKDLVEAIGGLIDSISGLARRAVVEYTPIVDSIVRNQSRDIQHIEHTLDGLVDFCFDPEALLLFKKLCRHYYFIDPAAAADYVRIYREMWDSEPEAQPQARGSDDNSSSSEVDSALRERRYSDAANGR